MCLSAGVWTKIAGFIHRQEGTYRMNSDVIINKKSSRTTEVRDDVVTRWRFELQTHCLKGNCSAN